MLGTAISTWRDTRAVNAKISALNQEIASLDSEHQAAMALLQLPQNAPVISNAKFLNRLIARKSFSWTRVFMQLEQIMPAGLHVISISPELQPLTNTVEVHLAVAGSSRDAAIELVKRLEQSSSFREASIVEERELPANQGQTDSVEFHLMAIYVPPAAKPASAAGAASPEAAAGREREASQSPEPSTAQLQGGAR
jgi:hypothetical protein